MQEKLLPWACSFVKSRVNEKSMNIKNRIRGALLAVMVCMTSSPLYGKDHPITLTLVYERVFADERLPPQRVSSTMQPGMTRLTDSEKTVFIDYDHLRLYRWDGGSGKCSGYALQNPAAMPSGHDTARDIRRKMIEEIGKPAVQKMESGPKSILGYPSAQYSIIWGVAVERLRTAVTPVIEQYGLSFTSRLGELWVTANLEGYADLAGLADHYTTIYAANPLLRQLDPLGLLPLIEGIPVLQQYDQIRDSLQEIRQGTDDADRIVLPDSCLPKP
jgi:hypothetical protein